MTPMSVSVIDALKQAIQATMTSILPGILVLAAERWTEKALEAQIPSWRHMVLLFFTVNHARLLLGIGVDKSMSVA